MRSPREIAYRLRQEAENIRLRWLPPQVGPVPHAGPLDPFPNPKDIACRLATTRFADEVLRIADRVLKHRFDLLGYVLETGPEIQWRRDYVHGQVTRPDYFRLVPYLNFQRAGDHKIIWELNRHQHLVTLAMAWRFTGRQDHLIEIDRQLESWEEQNPFQRGINWTSALEVAFRALSWIWVWHLAGEGLKTRSRQILWTGFARHGAHLATNLSFYFSPNTHLLGEAVALHAIGRLFPQLPQAESWRKFGRAVIARQMDQQVRGDGSHFEQSSYYHVYALDMFLFHTLLELDVTAEYRLSLGRMGDYLHAMLGEERVLPMIGDDDGGRFFHPYGPRDRFGRATMATAAISLQRPDWSYDQPDLHEQAAWWLNATETGQKGAWKSHLFTDAGLAVLYAPGRHITIDAGPFGRGRAGHSHSDTLSITARVDGREVLIDPGTYTYVADPEWRDRFRGSAAHNTIRINGRNQAGAMGPFWWADLPMVQVTRWSTAEREDVVEAECVMGDFRHRRRVRFLKPSLLEVEDEVTGPAGEHEIEQFWHLGSVEMAGRVHTDQPSERVEGWRSRVFGTKEAAPVLMVRRKTSLPSRFRTIIDL